MLNREKILEIALVLVDEGGPAHLTMRRLAERLGVTATAIYYHFAGREEVLDATAERLCADIAAGLPPQGSWTERLRVVLTAWQELAASHPTAMGWAITEYAWRPPVLRLHDVMLTVLRDAGFDPLTALHIKGALLRYCIGHLMVTDLHPGGDVSAVPGADAFPNFVAANCAVLGFDAAEQFQLGLCALLDGFAALRPVAPDGTAPADW